MAIHICNPLFRVSIWKLVLSHNMLGPSQFWHGINDKWTVSLGFFLHFYICPHQNHFNALDVSSHQTKLLSCDNLKSVSGENLRRIEGDSQRNLNLNEHHKFRIFVLQTIEATKKSRVTFPQRELSLRSLTTLMHTTYWLFNENIKGIIFTYRLQARESSNILSKSCSTFNRSTNFFWKGSTIF